MRGGPERTRTPGTQFYRTSLCHCPNVASAGASRRRKSNLRRCEPNQHRWRCTIRLDPAIKHRRTATTLSRKGWQSAPIGAVPSSVSGRQGRSEILPRRLDRRGGASVVRRPPRTVRARIGGNPHPAARSEHDWKVAAYLMPARKCSVFRDTKTRIRTESLRTQVCVAGKPNF
jgi:hypothetical protein